MRTLVIHPTDPSTDFLKPIYEHLECNVLSSAHACRPSNITKMIQNHVRIIMLGHGYPGGMYGHKRIVINSDHSYALKDKDIYAIWCMADQFFQSNNLTGVCTGMIISEPLEAIFFKVDYVQEELDESNILFADSVKQAIADAPNCAESFAKSYQCDGNRIVDYNKKRFYNFTPKYQPYNYLNF